MKKILYIFGGLYSPNGMGAVISEKVNYLADHTNYELFLVLTEHPEAPFFYQLSKNVKYVNLNINFDDLDGMSILKKTIYYLLKQRRYKKKLSQYLMEIKPDITVSITRREINFLTKIQDGSKKIAEIHFTRSFYRNIDIKYFPSYINKLLSRLWMKSLICNLRKLSKFVVLTHEDQRNWPELNNVLVIPNFISQINPEKSDCRNKRVVSAGRYSWEKGFDLLISAWEIVYRKHPDWRLDIYGNGNNMAYQQIADSKGLSSVVRCNHAVPNLYDHYIESGFFVLSSRSEGFGLVIIEAMGVGLPVVAFACPCGPKELIDDCKNGLLVEDGNIGELAEKISFLIENEAQRKKMGVAAAQTAASYTKEEIMKQWLKLFNDL